MRYFSPLLKEAHTNIVGIAFLPCPKKMTKKYANYFGDYIDDIFRDLMELFGGYFCKKNNEGFLSSMIPVII